MDTDTPRRRGRPPLDRQEIVSDEVVTSETRAVKAQGRRRRGKIGVHALKLSAPVRKGYKRRWVNDNDNRIAEIEELGYDFVHENGIDSDAVGSRVSRLVGTKPNGEPLRAYLVETPDELYAQGEEEREEHNRQIDEAIRAGRDHTNQVGNAYGSGSITVER